MGRCASLLIGGALVLLFLGAALLSLVWTPGDVTALNITNRLQAPSLSFWFGTDHFGRDIFSMILIGARTSIGWGSQPPRCGTECWMS